MDHGTPTVVRTGRPGVIVLIAFIVEVVVIGALANQVVTKHLVNFAADHNDQFAGHLVAAFTTYQWRIGAQAGDRANEPLAHACLILVVLALTALLVLAVCRGSVTFGRAFLGTWLAVIVSTLVGQIVFDLVSPPPYPPGFNHVSGAVFTGPDGFGFFAGLMLGLVTAIFVAIFAVATRRTFRPAAPTRVEEPRREEYDSPEWWDQTLAYPADYARAQQSPYNQPYSGSYYGEQVGSGAAEETGGGEAATEQMPVVPEDEQQQRPTDDDQPTGAIAPADGSQEFAHPPADEDAGQRPGPREP